MVDPELKENHGYLYSIFHDPLIFALYLEDYLMLEHYCLG